MTILFQAARLTLPTLFFGYAIMANLVLFTTQHPDVILPETGLLSGGLTRDLDDLYKKDLPHTDLSFGLIGAARYVVLGEARQGVLVGENGWLFSTEEVRPLPTDAQLTAIVATIRNIRTQLAADGTDLVIVPLPSKIDIYRAHSPDTALGHALEALYAEFSARLKTDGVAVVDARTVLLDPIDPVFFATDTHWTAHGAGRVAGAIRASGTILPGKLAFDRGQGDTKAFSGDLVGFVTTPMMALRIGLPAERIRISPLVRADAETDIFGSAAQDIVLVGTSYSANSDWGFADAVMQTLGRDVVSVAEQGLGPLEPMQRFLASPMYQDAPPAVVIWEIPVRYLTDPALWPNRAKADPEIAAMLRKESQDG